MTDATLTIPARFNGPPGVGQGGYTAGLLAAHLESAGPSEVRLRRPTPLDVPLAIERVDDGSIRAVNGGETIAECRPVGLEIDLPLLVTPQQAQDAAKFPEWMRAEYQGEAESEVCFVCCPRSDGLNIHPGHVAGTQVIACSVRPPSEFLVDGVFAQEIVWAILDCPSFWATWVLLPDQGRESLMEKGSVTGSLAVDILRLPNATDELFVQAWKTGEDGRKHFGEAVLVCGTDEIIARARQTAIRFG
jgi:hypothetical protein